VGAGARRTLVGGPTRIIDKAIAGRSLESIARELNEAKELSPVTTCATAPGSRRGATTGAVR